MKDTIKRQQVDVEDWGLIDYQEAWDRQTVHHKALIQQKRANEDGLRSKLIFCEHPPVFTLGKSGSESHINWDEEERIARGLSYYKINRGGDITYHGPGQLVVYPIFDLDKFFRDVHRYVRSLEEVVIRTLSAFDIKSQRMEGYTGVWIKGRPNLKICAIGVHLSRWVSMHGLAFNINTNLEHFEGIVPCGIQEDNKDVTSLSHLLGVDEVSLEKVKELMIHHFQEIFEFEIAEN